MPPRLARLLAAVLAVALVAGAFALRGVVADDDDEAVVADSVADVPPAVREEMVFQVLCDEDLGEEVCDAVAAIDRVDQVLVVTAEEVLVAAAAERGGDGEIDMTEVDAWLTLDPMPALLDEARRGAGRQPLTSAPALVEVASSSLALLSFAEGPLDCTPAAWRCLAEATSSQDVGIPAVTTSGGLAIAAAAFAALGGDDVVTRGIGALDGETADLVTDLAEGAEGTVAQQQATIATQRGRYDGVVTTDGWARRRTAVAPDSGLVATPLDPGTTIGVVLAGLGRQAEDAALALEEDLTEQTVREILANAGWGGEPARSEGLPDPDVIYALRQELG